MKNIVFLLLIIYLLQIVNSLPAGGDEAILTRTSGILFIYIYYLFI